MGRYSQPSFPENPVQDYPDSWYLWPLYQNNGTRRYDQRERVRHLPWPSVHPGMVFQSEGREPAQGVLRRIERTILMFVDASAIVAILTRERETEAALDAFSRYGKGRG